MDAEEVIPPDRLLEAVDAVLLGLAEMGPTHDGRWAASILGALDQPAAFCTFTRAEIIAAERFLIRCGLLPLPTTQPDASSEPNHAVWSDNPQGELENG